MKQKKDDKKFKPCDKHKPKLLNMGYLAAHAEAEKRMKQGQEQKQCADCKLWFFDDEM